MKDHLSVGPSSQRRPIAVAVRERMVVQDAGMAMASFPEARPATVAPPGHPAISIAQKNMLDRRIAHDCQISGSCLGITLTCPVMSSGPSSV